MPASEIRDLMWRHVGLFRERAGLETAVSALRQAWREVPERLDAGPPLDAERWRTLTIVTVARLIARAALRREESRGAHFRADFPRRDDVHWRKHLSDSLRDADE